MYEGLIERLRALPECVAAGSDSYRVFHGRGQVYPGLEMVCVDWFDPVVVVTLFAASTNETQLLEVIVNTLRDRACSDCVLLVQRRYQSGAPSEVLIGELPAEVYARRGSLRFALKLGERQNSGFFLDMEPGRQWLQARCEGKKVLNLFAYTCAFSVVAVAAGAHEVINVDMSRAALSLGRANHHLNRLDKQRSRFLPENIMKSWGRIKRPGPYDLAVIDPPSYQPGSFVAERDYAKVMRRIPQFMRPGGELLLCLNAPELGVEFLRTEMARECPECEFVGRLEPSADFPDVDPERQLKLLHWRYRG